MLVRFCFLFFTLTNFTFAKSAQIVSVETMIGKVPETFCEDKSFATFTLFFSQSKSDFIHLYFQKKQNSTELIFDDVGLEFKDDKKFINRLCDGNQLKIKENALSTIMSRIKKALPACSVRIEKKRGLVCTATQINQGFKKSLNANLIALKRQSYRVSRMTSLSQQILKTNLLNQKSVNEICIQIRSSDSKELPLILKEKSNQDLFCNKGSGIRSYFVSLIGIEANLLVNYIKKNTHLGIVKLVGPIQKQDYVVSVSPAPEFLLKIPLEAKSFARGCKFPYLTPNAQQVEYLKSLGMFHPRCKHERVSPEAVKDSLKLLWGLAASDGEFEVSMNRGKYIRLPIGKVRVQVKKAQNLGKPAIKSQKIQKDLLWDRKKRVFKVKL